MALSARAQAGGSVGSSRQIPRSSSGEWVGIARPRGPLGSPWPRTAEAASPGACGVLALVEVRREARVGHAPAVVDLDHVARLPPPPAAPPAQRDMPRGGLNCPSRPLVGILNEKLWDKSRGSGQPGEVTRT
jgi:hypothetical protein